MTLYFIFNIGQLAHKGWNGLLSNYKNVSIYNKRYFADGITLIKGTQRDNISSGQFKYRPWDKFWENKELKFSSCDIHYGSSKFHFYL